MAYDTIRQKLARGETIILDGGTGTDIQRRGAPMSGDTWCAEANLTHPAIVREVHKDYVACGSDIVTANTYATSPLLFSHIGREADVNRIDAIAVALAREAVAESKVCVAGSMSTMRPMQVGSDRNNLAHDWSEADARRLFRMKANGLKAAGVDLIMMEMMRDTDYAVWASEAALETSLPVWIGLSAEKSKDGGLQGWGRADCRFEDIARTLAALKPDVMCIMHTSPNDTGEAISILRRFWSGPVATYPECGYFKSPDWDFVDVIAPADLVAASREWQTLGATIFGGCCGIGPDHISMLNKELR
jgi:S-methylmethionine-dependent homocysteine/selenocysteine methylase